MLWKWLPVEYPFSSHNPSVCSVTQTSWPIYYPSGFGLQCTAEEGFLECSDALWDASPGCFHQPVVGQGPPREVWEGIQVSLNVTFFCLLGLKPQSWIWYIYHLVWFAVCFLRNMCSQILLFMVTSLHLLLPHTCSQGLCVSVHASPLWAGGWWSWDLCGWRPTWGSVEATRAHPHWCNVTYKEKGIVYQLEKKQHY